MHLLILLGPSLFGPRSRILLTIDGLIVQAWNDGADEEAFTHFEDENQCGGRIIGGRSNHAATLDQIRLPLSSIPVPTANVPREDDTASPERTENRVSSDSTKLSDSPPPPSGEPLTSHLGEQQAFSDAERLLSRSLAMACAEDGVTLNAELGPNRFSAPGHEY